MKQTVTTMKRSILTIVALVAMAAQSWAIDYETAREQAYYLTDKMAYELNLNEQQNSDAYEINLDYLLSLNTENDIEAAYYDYRAADLRYILYDWQWDAYLAAEYFYHPVHWFNGGWYFPIYRHYAHGYFFYDRPGIFWDYRGAHGRAHYMHASYYCNRRPMWIGGFRGAGQHMTGHPNGSTRGRYGTAGGGRGGVGSGSRQGGASRSTGVGSGSRQGGTSRSTGVGSGSRQGGTSRSTGVGSGSRQGGTSRSTGVGSSSRQGGNVQGGTSRSTGVGTSRSNVTSSRQSGSRTTGSSTMRSSSRSTGSSGSTRASGSSRSTGSSVSRSSGGGSSHSSSGGHSSAGGHSGGGGRR